MLTLGIEWRITPHDDLISDLTAFVGEEQVELEFN